MKNKNFLSRFVSVFVSVILVSFAVSTFSTGLIAVAQTSVPEDEPVLVEEVQAPQENQAPAEEQAPSEPSSEESAVIESEESSLPPQETEELSEATQTESPTVSAPEESTESQASESEENQVSEAEPVQSAPQMLPLLTTDKADYHPGEIATIFGSFFSPFTDYVLKIFGDGEIDGYYTESTNTLTANDGGSFSFDYILDNIYRPLYTVLALDLNGNMVASVTFSDSANAAGNLDQCRNGTLISLTSPCDWTNGNLGSQNSHYVEGQSAPYRAILTGVEADSTTENELIIGYDIKHSSRHAIDYLTSYNRQDPLVEVNPCLGVSGCTFASGVDFDISALLASTNSLGGQPTGSINNLTAPEKKFTIWNGNITAVEYVSQGDLTQAQSETRVKIKFTATNPTVVIAWGGHIGSRLDWGSGNSAGGISGSPYHMRLIALNGKGQGNQDRSLSADAIIVPGTIIIEKQTDPADSEQSFEFDPSWKDNFFLADNGLDTSNSLLPGTYSISEVNVPSGWSLTSATCFDQSPINAISLQEGETVTCTFTNTLQQAHLTLLKNVVKDHGGTALDTAWTLSASGPTNISGVEGDPSVTNAAVNAGVYTLSESGGPAGYTAGNWSCTGGGSLSGNELTLSPGENVTCEIINDDQPGNLIVHKTTIPVGDQTPFSITLSQNPASGDATRNLSTVADVNYEVKAGTYSVSEAAKEGWSETTNTCTNISITNGETKECTITNTKQGKIIVDKVTNSSGASQAFDFDPSWSQQNFSLKDTDTPNDSGYLNPGTYSVSEVNLPNGWVITSATCSDESDPSSIDLTAGETVTCTFTNTQNATLIVKKDMVGGTATFDFTGTPSGSISTDLGTIQASVAPGTYLSTEDSVAGWDLNSIICNDDNSTGDVGTRAATFVAEAGETVTCTFTNTRRGHIIVDKVTDPSGDSQTFSFDATGGNYADFSLTDAQVPNDQGLVPGAYSVVENTPTGWVLTGLTCNDSSGNVELQNGKANINLDPGETVNCTYTNTRLGSISGMKFEDENGNGAKDVGDNGLQNWEIKLTGASSATAQTDSNGNYSFTGLLPGTYQVCETLQSGWTQTSPTSGYDCGSGIKGYEITLAAGENATSKNFGNFELISISGKKFEDIDGDGAAQEAEEPNLEGWTVKLYRDGTPWTLVDSKVTDSNGAFSFGGLTNGTYRVCEVLQSGWKQTRPQVGGPLAGVINNSPNSSEEAPRCISITSSNTTSGNNTTNANLGNFKLGQISGHKFEDMDGDGIWDEGEPALENWTISLAGTVNDSVSTNSSGYYEFTGLTAGNYTISETVPAGWVQTYPTSPNTHSVIVMSGTDEKDKNFGNFESPKLTVIKDVINDNGGNAPASDFQISVKKDNVDVNGSPAAGSETGTVYTLTPGTYAVSEGSLPTGYTNITDDTNNVDCDANGGVVLQSGDNKTCTITNDDEQAYITVVKTVINDNGGNAQPNDFNLTLEGSAVSSGVAVPVNPGTYTAGETLLPGYTFTGFSDDCDENGDVTVALGQSKTCTLTNNDKSAKITLVKEVINDNGGTAGENDFGLAIGDTSVNSGGSKEVNSNTPVAINEAGLTGYEFVSITGHDKCPEVLGGVATLDEGEEITCTITNDDMPPSLTLVKVVVNDNGGLATESAWTLTAAGPTGFSGQGPLVSNGASFDAGDYNLSESGPAGYTASDWVCTGGSQVDGDTISVGLGQSATCTITNDDQTAHLKLVKSVTNDDGGNAVEADFTLSAAGPTPISGAGGVEGDVNAGTYTLSETSLPGYSASAWSCVGGTQEGSSVSLALGESATCTITNDDVAPKLTLIKNVITDNGGNALPDDFLLTIGGNPATSGTKYTLDANTPYAINETQITGYAFISVTGNAKCPAVLGGTVTLDEGDDITCAITNDDQPGTLIVHKVTVPSSDQTTQFPITLSATPLDKDANQNIVGGGSVSYSVNAGTYDVTESTPTGWDMTGNTCDDVVVTNGGEAHCTITNTQRGEIVLVKNTVGGDGSFDFVHQIAGLDSTLTTSAGSGSDTSDKLVPGDYAISETAPAGWDLTSATCDSGETIDNITVDPGETVTCTFTNTKLAKLTIVKDADPNDCKDFNFAGDLGEFILDDDAGATECVIDATDQPESRTFSDLAPNTSYTVTENVPDFWTLEAPVVCGGIESSQVTQTASGVTVNLKPGDDATCTFVNSKISPTRTQGFWKTHTEFTSDIFDQYFDEGLKIGTSPASQDPIITYGQLFGVWYSDVNFATEMNGKKKAKRTNEDKARILLAHQLVTAKLNCAAFGGCPVSVSNMIANADSAYSSNSVSQMNLWAGQLDLFNNSGDSIIISPPLPPQGKATPKDSQMLATPDGIKFWDSP